MNNDEAMINDGIIEGTAATEWMKVDRFCVQSAREERKTEKRVGKIFLFSTERKANETSVVCTYALFQLSTLRIVARATDQVANDKGGTIRQSFVCWPRLLSLK